MKFPLHLAIFAATAFSTSTSDQRALVEYITDNPFMGLLCPHDSQSARRAHAEDIIRSDIALTAIAQQCLAAGITVRDFSIGNERALLEKLRDERVVKELIENAKGCAVTAYRNTYLEWLRETGSDFSGIGNVMDFDRMIESVRSGSDPFTRDPANGVYLTVLLGPAEAARIMLSDAPVS